MPLLTYSSAVIPLRNRTLEELEHAIETRTEIRKARKAGVTVEILHGEKDATIVATCSAILTALLSRRVVPYDPIFTEIIADPQHLLLIARTSDGVVSSFIVVRTHSRNPRHAGTKTATLELSATLDVYKKDCPNYLLLWTVIEHLKKEDYDAFSLGLLTYAGCPDPDLESVAFFKRKWAIEEQIETEVASLPRSVYLKYFKRFRGVKKLVVAAQKVRKVRQR